MRRAFGFLFIFTLLIFSSLGLVQAENKQIVLEGNAIWQNVAASPSGELYLSGIYGEIAVVPLSEASFETKLLQSAKGKGSRSVLLTLPDGAYGITADRNDLASGHLQRLGNNGFQADSQISFLRDDDGDWAKWYIVTAAYSQNEHAVFMQSLNTFDYSQRILRLDLLSGETEVYQTPSREDMAVYPYKGNSFLTVRTNENGHTNTWWVFDWDTKTYAQELMTLTEPIAGICYWEAQDKLLYMENESLFAFSMADHSVKKLGELPFATTLPQSTLLSGRYYVALGNQQMLYLYDLLAESDAPEVLTIWGDEIHLAQGYLQFMKEHPNVTVKFRDTPSWEELAQLLITREVDCDLLCVSTSQALLPALMEKGYWVDLMQSDTLAAQYEKLLPAIAAPLTKQEHLCAWPIRLTLSNVVCYHDIEGVSTELPATFDELLAMMAAWPQELAEIKPLESFDIERTLLSMYLFRRYQEAQLRSELVDFASPDFLETLAHIKEASRRADEEWGNHYEEQPTLFSTDALPLGSRLLSLPIDPAVGTPLYGSLDVCLIYPGSEKVSLALSFLEACAKAQADDATLYIGNDAPVERANHAQNMAAWQEEQARLEQQLSEADGETAIELRDAIAAHEAERQRLEATRYQYTAEDIAYYQQEVAPNLVFPEKNVFTPTAAGDSQVEQLIARYLDGQLAPERLSSELNRLVRMMLMEE